MRKISDEKIKRYLDELGEEYKVMLLEQLVTNSNTLEELSISELIRLDEDVKYYLRTKDNDKRKNKYYVLGILYVFMGLFMYLFFNIMTIFDNIQFLSRFELMKLMSTIISMIGILLCMITFIADNKRKKLKNDNNKRKILEYEVIAIWKELEGLYYDISENKSGVRGR